MYIHIVQSMYVHYLYVLYSVQRIIIVPVRSIYGYIQVMIHTSTYFIQFYISYHTLLMKLEVGLA